MGDPQESGQEQESVVGTDVAPEPGSTLPDDEQPDSDDDSDDSDSDDSSDED